jgi:uncharacterized protein
MNHSSAPETSLPATEVSGPQGSEVAALPESDPVIQAFDAVCERLNAFEPGLEAEWIDGYLTALAASWRAIPIEEALPRMCGDAFERVFADPEDVARAMQALQARFDMLHGQLDPEALYDDGQTLRLAPLMQDWSSIDEDEIECLKVESGSDAAVLRTGAWWGAGFLSALDDFSEDWAPPRRCDREAAEDHAVLRRTVDLLVKDTQDPDVRAFLSEQWPAGSLPTREDLIDEALFAVQELRLWWAAHPPARAPIRAAATPGRNDPCSCGSGRKYKKCCGAG